MHGLVREFYPNKSSKAVLNYRDGKLNGMSKWFFPNGKIQAEKSYKNGSLEGESKGYDERTGTLAYIDIYENNKKKMRKTYDIDGEPLGAAHY